MERHHENRDGTALRAGSLAWLASGIGPQIAFAPEGDNAGGAGGEGGGAGGEGGEGGGSDTGGGAKIERPEGLSDEYWDSEKNEVKFKDLTGKLSELSAFKAEADSRAAQVPEAPDKYQAKLPEGFKPPEGVKLPDGQKLEINEADPRLKMARDFAHKQGFTQAEFEEMVALGVNADLAEMGEMQSAQAAQIEKLGSRGAERVAAAKTWLDAKLGPELSKSITGVLFASKQIEAVEKLMSHFRHDSPGRPGSGRETNAADVSDDEWEKMSPAARINHARQAQQKAAR